MSFAFTLPSSETDDPFQCIPDPDILRAMLPYMLKDPQLGLVRSRQGFYNLPKVMGSAFATFINAVEPSEYVSQSILPRDS